MMTLAEDRRPAPRRRLRLPIRFGIPKHSGSTLFELDNLPEQAEIRNVSHTGILFVTTRPISVGARLSLFVEVPSAEGTTSTQWFYIGHVVRVEPVDTALDEWNVGVQFDCYEILRSDKTQQSLVPAWQRRPNTAVSRTAD